MIQLIELLTTHNSGNRSGPSLFVLLCPADSVFSDTVESYQIEEEALPGLIQTVPRNFLFCIAPELLVRQVLSSLSHYTGKLSRGVNDFVILLERRDPPLDVGRYDGVVQAFLCRVAHACQALNDLRRVPCEMWCVTLVIKILNGESDLGIVTVAQIPPQPILPAAETYELPPTVAVLPHRGKPEYLALAIAGLQALDQSDAIRIAVGLDVDTPSSYSHLCNESRITLYQADTEPAGPYVFRQAIVQAAQEELLLFQDSDDLPCFDRATTLYNQLRKEQADMVGSHELEVNEIDGVIRAYRYPLNVTLALSGDDVEGLSDTHRETFLHATAMIYRHSFEQVGGFSTNRRIASDSQFLLRACFSLKIVNSDEFLYIRRVHKLALTVAPETRDGNAYRKALSHAWRRDFKHVKQGLLSLKESSLTALHGDVVVSLFGCEEP